MDRNFNVDDVVSEIWRFSTGGLPTSESDAALQQLLKSAPSVGNLAPQADANGAQELGGNAVMASSSAQTPGVENTGENAGVPRVPSLDLLRQIVPGAAFGQAVQPVPTSADPSAAVGAPAAASVSQEPTTPAAAPLLQMQHPNLAGLTAEQQLASALSAVSGLPHGSLINPLSGLAPAAAAALQLHQLGHMSKIDKEAQEKAEERRERRMLSNRESARRSRRRKQEHLKLLEVQVGELAQEKEHWNGIREGLESRCTEAEQTSKQLRDENNMLRQQLHVLQQEIETIKGGSTRSSPPPPAEPPTAPPPTSTPNYTNTVPVSQPVPVTTQNTKIEPVNVGEKRSLDEVHTGDLGGGVSEGVDVGSEAKRVKTET